MVDRGRNRKHAMARRAKPVKSLLICPKCKLELRLLGIESESTTRDLYTFECSTCGRLDVAASRSNRPARCYACGLGAGLKTSGLRRKNPGAVSRISAITNTPTTIAPTPNTSGAPMPWIAVLPWFGSL
jgi:hypothetical protein